MTEERHIELYKRYRPRTWKNLIGQDKVVKSLQGAVANGKVPTAYAFLGERGCGKTSAALILAKSLNCDNVQNGEPCNECEICVNIDNGNQLGVNYISMANKGSADDVREIVQQARLATSLNRQVWILDEVHNLSKQAFDALLIPLEDPKMPSLFILCSTEANKIPETIMTRVQSRKFSLVSDELMTAYLKKVAERENIEATDETIASAVRMGGGSVRGALSALERVSETDEEFTNYGDRLLEAYTSQDLAKTFAVIAEAAAEDDVKGLELGHQLFGDLRDLLLFAAGADRSLFPRLALADPKSAAESMLGIRGISIAIDEIGEALTRMSFGADSRVHLEAGIVRSMQKLKVLKSRMEK